jgi:hypothetical protein
MAYYHVHSGGSNTSPYDTWAKAATSVQTIIDLPGLAAGDIVYCKGTLQAGGAVDFDGNSGTWDDPIKFIGVNDATTNEGAAIVASDLGTNRYHIDANEGSYNAATINGMNYVWFLNFQFENSGNGDGLSVVGAEYTVWVNCRFTGNAAYGVDDAYLLNQSAFKQCMFDANNTGIDYPDSLSYFVACRFSLNTTEGMESAGTTSAGPLVLGCVFSGNGTGGESTAAGCFVGCVFDDHDGGANDYGASVSGSVYKCYIGCRFTNNDVGLDTTSGSEACIDYCYFENDTTDIDAAETVWQIPDSTNTSHVVTGGSDTYGYEAGELNLASDATYFSEEVMVPAS